MDGKTNWIAPPAELELSRNEIHIWRALLDVPPSTLLRFSAHLNSEEIERAERFVFPADRNRFMAGRGVLRTLLGKYLHRSPESIPIRRLPRGKPFLEPQMGISSVSFNISHSQGLALFAFCSLGEVGVDLEKIRKDAASEEIAERYFSAAELAELRELPPESRTEGFFLCWTRKEAYVKALGEGLGIPLADFSVTLTPNRQVCLTSADSDRWSLYPVDPGMGFVGACVGEGRRHELRCFDYAEESES